MQETLPKCSMLNEKGFALITVMFMLVSLISLIFLTAYLLIAEQREDSRVAKEDMDIHRYFRGILGRSVEQCGGKFMACGGFVSDIERGGGSVIGTTFSRLYGRRLAGRDYGGGWAFYDYSPFWRYHPCGFWSGWRGKRYMHRLPCDDWDEGRMLSEDQMSVHSKNVFFTGTGKTLTLFTQCGSLWGLRLLEQDGEVKRKMKFGGGSHHYIIVKDYTRTDINKVNVVLLGSTNNCYRSMTSRDPTPYPKGETPDWDHYHEYEVRENYILHVFKLFYQPTNQAYAKLYAFCGLKKAMVYIDGKPKYSVPLVVPPRSCTFMAIDYCD